MVEVVLVFVIWALLRLCLDLLLDADAGIRAGFILFGYQKHIPLLLVTTPFLGCWFNLSVRTSTRMNYDRGSVFPCKFSSE